MPDFLNDTVQTLGDPLRNMMLALQGNQPAPPATPQGVSGALNQTLLRQTGDDPGNDFMNSTASAAGQAGKVGSPMEWAMALAGGPRLHPRGGGRFEIMEGDTGRNVGYISTSLDHHRPEGPSIYVDGIHSDLPSAQNDAFRHTDMGRNSYGPKDVKEIINQLREYYPEATGIAGYRVSGTRGNVGRGAADAYMPFKAPEPGAASIMQMANKFTKGWQSTVNDLTRANDANLFNNMRVVNDRSPLLNNPDVAEIAARREAVRHGYPNWSEVHPDLQADFRDQVARRNPTTADYAVGTPAQEQATRNRWLGAQQRQWRRDLNNQTRADIANHQNQMAEVLAGQRSVPAPPEEWQALRARFPDQNF